MTENAKEHPLELPCQISGFMIGTIGVWIGLATPNTIVGIIVFSVGALLFVRAPHNYGDLK